MVAGIITKMAWGAGTKKIFWPTIRFNMIAMGHGGRAAVGVKYFTRPAALFAAFFTLPIGLDLDRFCNLLPIGRIFFPVLNRHGSMDGIARRRPCVLVHFFRGMAQPLGQLGLVQI
jgi:hypothetical protein